MRYPTNLPNLLLPAVLGLAGPALAQTPLSGNVSDGTTGPLLGGQVYLATGSLTVPAGQTLTIQPGAILKLGNGQLLNVFGELVSPPGAPAFITSDDDDTVGGDTNNDGPSTGAAGDWSGVRVLAGSSIDLSDVWIGFAGASVWAPIYAEGGTIALRQCTISTSASSGIDGNGFDVDMIVEDTAIEDCAQWAMDDIAIEQLPNFSGNVASGNAAGDAIRLAVGAVDRDTTVLADNLIGGQLLPRSGVTVQVGVTLAIEAGVGVKLPAGALITVNGTLDVNGTSGSPVSFTALADDSVLGDTENDGPQPVGPGAWAGVRSRPGGSVEVDFATFRYAGASVWSPLYIEGGALTLRDSTVELSNGAGVDCNSLDVPIVIESCSFDDNQGWPIDEILVHRVPGLLGNAASGNGAGDAVRAAAGTLNVDTTLISDNLIDSTLVVSGTLTVNSGVLLGVREGVIVKLPSGALVTILGTLETVGTQANPVTLTAIDDDAIGTDVVNDGPTSGAAGDWSGVRSSSGGRVDASWTDVRFAGASVWSAFYIDGGELFLDHCSVFGCQGPGVDANGSTQPLGIVACHFADNSGVAIDELRVTQVPNLDSNTASGNAGGDTLRTTTSPVTQDTTIGRRNLIQGCFVSSGSFNVNPDVTLRFDAGTGVKFPNGALLSVQGTLETRGTADAPVVFSSDDDDSFGGDSLADGPTVGSPGDWSGVRNVPGNPGPARFDLEQLVVRYGGASVWSNLLVLGEGHVLRAVRSESSSDEGFRFDSATLSQVVNCTAWNNATAGFELNGGDVSLVHASATGNLTGVRSSGVHAGSLTGSLVFGNGTDLQLAPGTGVAFTNAANAPAGSGNSVLDPLFVDPLGGDLRLQLASPAVDTADNATALPLARDAADAPRLLSPSGLGGLQADRGAFEQARWSLSMAGTQAIGEPLSFQVDGEPGLAYLAYSPLQLPLLFEPYGVLLIGPAPIRELGLLPVGAPLNLVLPDVPALVGAEYGIQALAFFGADPLQSQLTDVERLRIEPALP